jgi:hypothetical protein
MPSETGEGLLDSRSSPVIHCPGFLLASTPPESNGHVEYPARLVYTRILVALFAHEALIALTNQMQIFLRPAVTAAVTITGYGISSIPNIFRRQVIYRYSCVTQLSFG